MTLSTPAPPAVLPVGRFVGTFGRPDEPEGRQHEVQRGGIVHELTDEQFELWLTARTGAPVPADRGHLLPDLRDHGLLVDAADPATFARAHRVVPTMLGLGNDAEEPALSGIGWQDEEILRLGRAAYHIWFFGHLRPSLWDACLDYVAIAREGGSTDPVALDVTRLAEHFLRQLTGLLPAGAAYIDLPAPISGDTLAVTP